MLVQNVWIVKNLLNGNTFDADIKIDFVPEQVIIKQCVYRIPIQPDDPDEFEEENQISLLYSDLIKDHLIAFYDSMTQPTPTTFPLNKSVYGTYKFIVKNVDGKTSNKQGQLAFLLQFVKN